MLQETSGHGFLARVDVHVAAHLALAESSCGGVFEQPDLNHLLVDRQQFVIG
jgi:hypothetical protein